MAYVPIVLDFLDRFMDSLRTYRIAKIDLLFGFSQYKDVDGGLSILLASLFLCLFLLLVRVLKCRRKQINIESSNQCKTPPTAPYWVPFVGNLGPFFVDLESLLASIVTRFGTSKPIRIALGTEEVFLLTGAQNLKHVWKNSQWLTAKAGHLIGLRTILDTPERSMNFYQFDNSGIGKEPLPLSNVPREHRVWHLTHQPIVDCLSGAKLNLFTDHFQERMTKKISNWHFGHQWTTMPDLFTYIYEEVMEVQLELLCGTFFLEQTPSFVQDFRQFHHAMIHLKKGLPRWMTLESCRARNVCLKGVKKWHKALQLCDPDRLVDTGEIQNQRFGNEIMRSRRRIMSKMDAMDEDTAASADLGMLWALNANPATASFWFLLEIVRDPSLHATIHSEISAASTLPSVPNPRDSDVSLQVSMDFLNDSPLLQSMYAETLRLRVAVLIIQSAEFGAFDFKGWLLPKDKLILISSRIAHMDQENWGRKGEPAVSEFWAERFLTRKHESKPGLSPKSKAPGVGNGHKTSEARRNHSGVENARFSTAGLAGKWIPYGGGPGICPGRHFAKNIMLLTSALMFSAFEIELLVEEKWRPQMDMRYYGLGVVPPRGKIPFKIRRRGS